MDNLWYHAILYRGTILLNAFGIDVSKDKSTVTILQCGGVSQKTL